MLDSMLQKKSTGVEPHYAMVEKLLSNNIKCYA
jgi:hypothetical protein